MPFGSALLDALDQERDAHVGAPLVEVLAAQADGDDVDGLDVAQGPAGLGEGVAGRRRRRTPMEEPTSSMIFTMDMRRGLYRSAPA